MAVNFSGSLVATGSIISTTGFTGSLSGTASNAATASSADNFLVRGTLTAQTINVQTITSSVDFVTGSSINGSLLTNTHQFTGSVSITGSLAVNGIDYNTTSASFDTRILNNSASIAQLSGSYLASSASFDSRISVISSSYATTGSNIFVGNQTITGSLLISGSTIQIGSNTLVGDTSLSGSVNISGSTNIQGTTNFNNASTTITGSLLVSGSTTQIGNNTLTGNTLLSGSLIVSGSQGLSTATIGFFGDVDINGTLGLLPVSANIDNTLSGSYVYVSGSTQDLYFTQNNKGYTNTTRLRWLEGNLYTGLLNGGLITAATGSTTFNVSSGSGIIVNLGASLTDNPYPTIQYVNWGNLTNQPLTYLTSSIQTFVGINSSGTITQQTTAFNDGQYNTIITIGTVLHQNKSTVNASITYPNVAYGYKQRSYDFLKAFGPLKLSGLTINTSSSLGLTVGSGTAFAEGRNYQIDPNNPSYITDSGTSVSKIFRYYQSGSEFVQDTNNGAGYTVIDPSNYNPGGSGSLAAVPGTGVNKEWSIQRVFWYPNSATKGIVVYYGSATYASEVDAASNLPYESFLEVENTRQNAVYLGALLLRNDAVFTDPTTYKILPGGLFRNVGGSGGGGTAVSTLLSSLSDVNISGPTDGQPLVYSSAASKWVNASSLTASLNGNADTATTASYALTSSYVQNAISSSYTILANTSSYALTASYVLGQSSTSSYALTASYVNPLVQDLLVTGSVTMLTNKLIIDSNQGGDEGGEILLGKAITNTTLTGSGVTIDVYQNKIRFFEQGGTARGAYLDISTLGAAASTNLLGTATTAISASYAATASYVQTAQTASYVLNAISSSFSTLAQTAQTASYIQNAQSASYWSGSIINAATASYVLNAISSSFATTSSYANDFRILGSLVVTGSIQSYRISSSVIQAENTQILITTQPSSTYSNILLDPNYVSLYTQDGSTSNVFNLYKTRATLDYGLEAPSFTGSLQGTADYALSAASSSFASTASFVQTAQTASFVQTAQTASYVLNAISASFAATTSFADNLTVAGTLTAQTIVAQTITSSIDFVTGSTRNGSTIDNTHEFTGSVSISGSLAVNNSSVILTNQTSSMSVATASYWNDSNVVHKSGTESIGGWKTFTTFVSVSSNASVTALNVFNSGTGKGLEGGSQGGNGGYIYNNSTSSAALVVNNQNALGPIAQFLDNSFNPVVLVKHTGIEVTGSLQVTAGITGSLLGTATTASYVLNAVSSSYASTSSYSNDFTIGNTFIFNQTLTDYISIPSSIVGSNNLFTKSTGSYTSAFVKYTVTSGSNARSGEIMTVWNAGSSQYVDNSTLDIGDTSGVILSAAIISDEIQIDADTSTSGWVVKAIGTFM